MTVKTELMAELKLQLQEELEHEDYGRVVISKSAGKHRRLVLRIAA